MKIYNPFHRVLSMTMLLIIILSTFLSVQKNPRLAQAKGIMEPEADTIAPAAITNLVSQTGNLSGTIELSWIAPGDDATAGTAAVYIVRYNTSPINETNWTTSADVAGEPAPHPAGSMENMVVAGLAPGRVYYFAIKTQDENQNISTISNSPGASAYSPHTTYLPLTLAATNIPPTVIPDTTEVLPETTTQYISSISGDGSIFTFSQTTPSLDQLAAGDVMVSEPAPNAPQGFLRKVASVSRIGNQVIVNTTDATLEDAIESGAARAAQELTIDQIQSNMQLRGVTLRQDTPARSEFYLELKEVVLFDLDGDLETKEDQIKANGSIHLKPSFDIHVVFKDGRLDTFSFTSKAVESTELKISAQVNLQSAEFHKEIAQYIFHPTVFMLGAVPIVIVPVLDVYVGLDGSVHVGVVSKVEQKATSTFGVYRAAGQWYTDGSFVNEFHFAPPTLSAGLDAKGFIGAQLSLLLYGITGPYGKLNAYLKLEADVLATPWWKLYGGLEASGGVKAQVFSNDLVDYEKSNIFGYKLLLAEAQSNNPPNLPNTPSPADMSTLQDLNADLSWSGGDLNNDAVTYDIYFEAEDSTPDVLAANDLASNVFDPGLLNANTHYYWSVVAQDEHGATTAGPVWEFTTATGASCPINLALQSPQVNDLDVSINGSVTSSCSTITRLNWQWGDGTSEDRWFPASHTYATAGAYTITVVAYNDLGESKSATKAVNIGLDTRNMVYIPASAFWMGCDSNNPQETCLTIEQPLHGVTLDAYYIDKYEVTNQEYAQCVAAGVCTAPSSNSSNTRSSYYNNPAYANYPVIYVNWHQANTYCAWKNKRLLTEAEWERAARGSNGYRIYPWGNQTPTCSLANYSSCIGDTNQVGSYPTGVSPEGVFDLAGNVGEWVNDWFSTTYYSVSPPVNPPGPASGEYRSVRPSSWYYDNSFVRVAFRSAALPENVNYLTGIRCAASDPSATQLLNWMQTIFYGR